jgi:hypothetical protein
MSVIRFEPNTIFFVYLADSMPSYGTASLKLAKKMSNSQIHIIGNEGLRQAARGSGVGFTCVDEFYSPKSFEEAKDNLSSDPSFRNGFWIKSLERLFILEQFYESRNLTSIFHAELDQLLFDTEKLIHGLNSATEKGIFFPFHSKDAVVASVLFINDLNAIQSVIKLAKSGESFNNEMMLLARWATLNPSRAFALPTLATEIKDSSAILPTGVAQIDVGRIGGIVDAAQIGQWVGGIDPRNVPIREKPITKFVDAESPGLLTRNDLTSLNLELIHQGRELYCRLANRKIRIYNLHLHSKAHLKILNGKPSIQKLIEESNALSPLEIPGMRRIQFAAYVSKLIKIAQTNPARIFLEIKLRFLYHLKIRPSSYPFISGDTFRKVAQYTWESNSKRILPSELQPGDIIFCESELFEELYEEILFKNPTPIVLVLGNSDKNHTSTEIGKRKSLFGSFIFAQNILDEIPNFGILPIGLENAWRSKNGLLSRKALRRASTNSRRFRIMWGFNVGTNRTLRSEAARLLKKNKNADDIGNVSPKVHQTLLGTYAFVASPPGNGLDTHRTWEAMYFRCVPIVLRSFMTSQYESMGLPIWVVDSYEEIQDMDETSLKIKYDEYKEKFDSEIIWAGFWIRRLKNASKEISGNVFIR